MSSLLVLEYTALWLSFYSTVILTVIVAAFPCSSLLQTFWKPDWNINDWGNQEIKIHLRSHNKASECRKSSTQSHGKSLKFIVFNVDSAINLGLPRV